MTRPPETGRARDIPRTFRLTQAENLNMEQQAADRGFASPSAYVRWLIAQDAGKSADKKGGKRA